MTSFFTSYIKKEPEGSEFSVLNSGLPSGTRQPTYITSFNDISKPGYYMAGGIWEGSSWADIFATIQTDGSGVAIGLDIDNPNKIYTAVRRSGGNWVKGSVGQ